MLELYLYFKFDLIFFIGVSLCITVSPIWREAPAV